MINFTKERNSYVGLILDEVHINEELIYDNHEGSLIGFANLGEINHHLMKFEKELNGESQSMPNIAGTMFCGLLIKLNFPYAQFACSNLTGDQLVDPVWDG